MYSKTMPEGLEVKTSFYYNSFLTTNQKYTFEILVNIMRKSMQTYLNVKQSHPKYFQTTFTIGKIFLPLSNGQYFNFT